ncbi:MAG: VanZ family protein [Coprobacillus sp.]
MDDFIYYEGGVEFVNTYRFPYIGFVVISMILIYYFYRKNKQVYKLGFITFVVIYIVFVICVLFFPVVTYAGENYNFRFDLRLMILFTSPLYRLEIQTAWAIVHYLMFVPLGYIVNIKWNRDNAIWYGSMFIAGIEIVQVLICFLTQYLQYSFDFGDVAMHLTGFIFGVLCYRVSILIPFVQNKLRNFVYAKPKKEVNYDRFKRPIE